MFTEILTNPKEHDPNNFIYLVHGINNGINSIMNEETIKKVTRIKNPNEYYRASLVGKLNEETAKEMFGLNQEIYQIGTYTNIGLIIKPPNDSIIQIAWNCDIGSPLNQEELKCFVKKHRGKIKYPLELLIGTKNSPNEPLINYNEIILKGDPNTRIVGIFYRQSLILKDEGERLRRIVSKVIKENVSLIELPIAKSKNYNRIKDPEERKRKEAIDKLIAEVEGLASYSEFLNTGNPWNSYREKYHISEGPLCHNKFISCQNLGNETLFTLPEQIRNINFKDISKYFT